MSGRGPTDGGSLVAGRLAEHGVRWLFTLVGGHISPILVAARRAGLRVVDVRHEATAVFAADAVSRLSDQVGVAVVTAGPGVTNTLTALKNAHQAQSPLLLIGGATATLLKGRGSLQDIDQLAVIAPHVKWARRVTRVADLIPSLDRALAVARAGVPGPVFLEFPLDLLYAEATVRDWTMTGLGADPGLAGRALRWWVGRHLDRQFAPAPTPPPPPAGPPVREASPRIVRRLAGWLGRAERPVLLVGGQALAEPERAQALAAAVASLGAPVFLAGGARGLLGRNHPLHLRSARKQALGEADLVIVAGLPFDFRLNYGRHIAPLARLAAVNLAGQDLVRNRMPDLAMHASPGRLLMALARAATHDADRFAPWRQRLAARDVPREAHCLARCGQVDPLLLATGVDQALADDSVVVADGGDFVATASYLVQPRGPLSWLDPGVFGTLGVGAGFAIGAGLVRPGAEIWILFGDGSLGYSLIEFDTFCRHGIPAIAVVGNDASWAQIARDQIAILGDDVATVLASNDYHLAVAGLGPPGRGPVGLLLEDDAHIGATLAEAKRFAAAGRPVLINARISTSDFRTGSISI